MTICKDEPKKLIININGGHGTSESSDIWGSGGQRPLKLKTF